MPQGEEAAPEGTSGLDPETRLTRLNPNQLQLRGAIAAKGNYSLWEAHVIVLQLRNAPWLSGEGPLKPAVLELMKLDWFLEFNDPDSHNEAFLQAESALNENPTRILTDAAKQRLRVVVRHLNLRRLLTNQNAVNLTTTFSSSV